MLKNTGRSKINKEKLSDAETHFSYENYRKKVKKNPHKDFLVFLSVLMIGILIFLGFAKILSPNVDVEIGGKDDYSTIEEEVSQGKIDERLKQLQEEDKINSTNSPQEDLFTPELDEVIVLPSKVKKTINEMEQEIMNDKSQKDKAEEPAAQNQKSNDIKQDSPKAPTGIKPADKQSSQHQTTYRVVVGNYATDKQAEVAKSIMQDAGLGVTPIVKNIGDSYTLQVGVFSSKEKAQQSVNNLLKNNFPARITE